MNPDLPGDADMVTLRPEPFQVRDERMPVVGLVVTIVDARGAPVAMMVGDDALRNARALVGALRAVRAVSPAEAAVEIDALTDRVHEQEEAAKEAADTETDLRQERDSAVAARDAAVNALHHITALMERARDLVCDRAALAIPDGHEPPEDLAEQVEGILTAKPANEKLAVTRG